MNSLVGSLTIGGKPIKLQSGDIVRYEAASECLVFSRKHELIRFGSQDRKCIILGGGLNEGQFFSVCQLIATIAGLNDIKKVDAFITELL